MFKEFLICGTMGWVMEILWTGLNSLLSGNYKMVSTTSLLMFPIYGMAVLFKPLYSIIRKMPIFLRGVIYALFIFTAEYSFGIVLKSIGACPWDYSQSPFNIFGVIRLDYAPLWFIAGLIFEAILIKPSFKNSIKKF